MNRSEYIATPEVAEFLAWVAPIVSGDRPLRQAYTAPSGAKLAFASFYEAYERLSWRFSVDIPGTEERWKGDSFEDNAAVMERLSTLLRASVARKDKEAFLASAEAAMDWGGVRQNISKLRRGGGPLAASIAAAALLLDPEMADLDALDAVEHMNAGYSRLYALLLDGFPIYDSRVASALGSLIRRFCEETDREHLTSPLALGIPPSREDGPARNPATAVYRFPALRPGHSAPYARANLRAAWLLGEMCEVGPFAELPEERRLLAVQSACFMLGYTVLPEDAFA